MTRRRVAGAVAAGILVAAAPVPAAVAGVTQAQLQAARLAGPFRLSGTITDTAGVPGERRGGHIARAWFFGGSCPSLPCRSVGLLRNRANGRDGLTLRRTAPDRYTGSSSFALPVRCAGRRYATGLVVPFTITVVVAGVRAVPGGLAVTAIRASYVSRSRTNRTPCVVPPAHEAAHYTGTLG